MAKYKDKSCQKRIQFFGLQLSTFFDCRALITHASVEKEERDRLGISDNLIRLSVGLESVEDLLADIDSALKGAVKLSNL